MTQDENTHEITIERPTGPRLTMADPASKGQVASYRAGSTARRVVSVRPSAKAFAALIALGVILPAILGMAWISARIDPIAYEAFAASVGPFTVNAQGWTAINPIDTTSGTCGGTTGTSNGSCIYYVANDGTDDATNCKGYVAPITDTPATKCQTINFAMTRIRSSKPDWVLLKRGQTFTQTSRFIFGASLGGADADHPFVMSAYPREPVTFDDRPILDATARRSMLVQAGTLSAAFISLRFTDSSFNPNSPNYWATQTNPDDLALKFLNTDRYFLLFEDCEFTYGIASIGGSTTNASGAQDYFRRNVFWNDGPPNLAFFNVGGSNYILMEENLLYKDWTNRSSVASSVTITAASPAVITYAHDVSIAPENGGMPPFGVFGNTPYIGLQGTLPTGLTAISTNCDQSSQCYYLCNIAGATANLSRNASCTPLINTSGSACNVGCSSRWNDMSASIFDHNVYVGTGWESTPYVTVNGIIFRNNITAYASATGSQIRQGGVYYNNLYVKNPIQLIGVGWPSDLGYNVITQAINAQTAVNDNARGWGMEIVNYQCAAPAFGFCTQPKIDTPVNTGSSGTRIHHNVMAKSDVSGNGTGAIHLGGYQFYNVGVGAWIGATTGIGVDNNIICDWHTSNNTPYTDAGTGNTLASSNKPDPATANVDTTCAALGIAAPATVGNYYESIGGTLGSTTDDFLNYCKDHWTKVSWLDTCMAKAANAYIRPTYGISNPSDTRTVRMTVQ